MRNLELEIKMLEISKEIWQHLKQFTIKEMPKIESKQGGHSGCYYP